MLLTFASILIVAAFFQMPANREWLKHRIFTYYRQLPHQWNNPDLEYRKIERYGNPYVYSVMVAQVLHAEGAEPKDLLLVPCTRYFRSNRIDFEVPEPVVFYYFSGTNTVGADNKNASEAKFFLTARNGRFRIERFGSSRQVSDSVESFSKWLVK